MSAQITRKLTTILAADAERFSSAMEADEVGTFSHLRASRSIFTKLIERRGGRIANTAGDGLIADFPSVVEAVQCAIEVQQELDDSQNGLKFRIGVHLGDVICDGEDLIGEGVNLAARLQTMAEPGGILVSQQVFDQVHNKLSIGFESLGEQRPHNFQDEVPVYRISTSTTMSTDRARPGPQAAAASQPGSRPPQQAAATPQDTMQKLRKYALPIVAGLLALNLAFGDGFWIIWPLLGLGLAFGLARGHLIIGRKTLWSLPIQLWVIAGTLLMINLVTWGGYMWSLWPIGALTLIGVLKQLSSESAE